MCLLAVAWGTTAPLAAGDLGRPGRLEVPGDARPIQASGPRRATPTELQPAPGAVTARWAGTARHPLGDQSPEGRLQWRQRSAARQVDAQSRRESTAELRAWRNRTEPAGSRPVSRVHPVAQLSAIDPFDDPFGDKQRQAAGGSPKGPEAKAPAPALIVEEPALASPAEPPLKQEGRRETSPLLAPEASSPAPAIPEEGQRRFQKPGDGYNERDCEGDQRMCRQVREYLRANPITKISLDITPELTVARLDRGREFDEQKFQMEMARVPSRTFRDRKGSVVAEGRMCDYRNGRVSIAGADGEIRSVPFASLGDEEMCFVTAWWSIPSECTLGDDVFSGRDWAPLTMTWKASGVCHKPLYFEEVQLERYGHTAGPIDQPFVSGAHFFLNIAALPYHMGIHPPQECQYPLGYYRPGNCAPWLLPPLPLSIRGGLLAAGLYTGGVYVLP